MNDEDNFWNDIRITISRICEDETIEVVKCGTKEWLQIMSEMVYVQRYCDMLEMGGYCEEYCCEVEMEDCDMRILFIRQMQDSMI